MRDLVELLNSEPDWTSYKPYSKDFEAEVVPEVPGLDEQGVVSELELVNWIDLSY